MSSAVGIRLLKGHKLLKYCHNLAASYMNICCPLVNNRFTFLKRRKFNMLVTANCSNVSNGKEAPDEREKRILEDDDIQNILRDFAKDFDVDEESSKILEDIKRTQNIPEKDGAETQSDPSKSKSLEAYRVTVKKDFKEYKDSDNEIVLSSEEQINRGVNDDYFFHIDNEIRQESTKKHIMEAKRGVTGVYDIHELVDVLHEEKMFDIAVISIPSHYHYADYMVLANGKSVRHLEAAAENINKFYKKKKSKADAFVRIEGEKLSPWKAMDMGNIVLHLFLEETRACYDIESLWLLDREFDSGGQGHVDDEEVDALKEQMEFLESLQQAQAAGATAEEQLQP